MMDEVVVTTTRRRGSDIALLAEQKKASLVIQRIGAQELSRVGVSDAAAAVAKMSGISKEEGGTQGYIRGWGDRYVTTSFNGMPLPSNDPELKNIALDLFYTDIIEFVAVEIGKEHVRTPVTNAHIVRRLLFGKKKDIEE